MTENRDRMDEYWIDHTGGVDAAAEDVDWDRALVLAFELGSLFESLNRAAGRCVRRTYQDFTRYLQDSAYDRTRMRLFALEALRQTSELMALPKDLMDLKAMFVEPSGDDHGHAQIEPRPRGAHWCPKNEHYVDLATGASIPGPTNRGHGDDDLQTVPVA